MISCDNCDETYLADSGFSIFTDKSSANEMCGNDDWFIEDSKHYCPNCWDLDKEDNLIIKPEK